MINTDNNSKITSKRPPLIIFACLIGLFNVFYILFKIEGDLRFYISPDGSLLKTIIALFYNITYVPLILNILGIIGYWKMAKWGVYLYIIALLQSLVFIFQLLWVGMWLTIPLNFLIVCIGNYIILNRKVGAILTIGSGLSTEDGFKKILNFIRYDKFKIIFSVIGELINKNIEDDSNLNNLLKPNKKNIKNRIEKSQIVLIISSIISFLLSFLFIVSGREILDTFGHRILFWIGLITPLAPYVIAIIINLIRSKNNLNPLVSTNLSFKEKTFGILFLSVLLLVPLLLSIIAYLIVLFMINFQP